MELGMGLMGECPLYQAKYGFYLGDYEKPWKNLNYGNSQT
jgi:hypothetical protein